MSVTFSAFRLVTLPSSRRVRVNPGARLVESACLCAQDAPSWDMYLEGTDLLELREYAEETCVLCGGIGVSPIEEGGIDFTLGNLNAAAFLALLGIDSEYLVGELSIAEARRATMRARARFDAVAPVLVREGVDLVSPRGTTVRADGVVELTGGRYRGNVGALELEDLEGYVQRFGLFVEAAARGGASSISWG